MLAHYLSPLLSPASVALVGATEREGALGRHLMENLLKAGFRGPIYAVNPKHGAVFGVPCVPALAKLPAAPDLIVVATPAHTVAGIIREAGEAGVGAAIVLSAGFTEMGGQGNTRAVELADFCRRANLRMIGPNCLGIMRPGVGLDATFANARAKAGALALVSQSGAVCTAILDWAATTEIGFSSVVSLGGALDVDFGEILDFLVHDPETRSILLYVEGIRDARQFVSALRAAARVKPVIVLKAGRHQAGQQAASSHTGAMTGNDAVFDAVIARSGAVRVRSSLQLFAAARLLSEPRLARTLRGERLCIITNGGGPGVVAADCATDHGLTLAKLQEATVKQIGQVLPPHWSHANPIDLIGDATAERFAAVIDAVAADANVDAILTLFCPQRITSADAAATATIDAASRAMTAHAKPVFTAWLGGASVQQARTRFDRAGIPNFLTPENAIDAFSYLTHFRRHQAQLLAHVPATPSASRAACEAAIAVADAIRVRAKAQARELLYEHEAKAILHAFGIGVALGEDADSAEAAQAAAKRIGFPVVMKIRSRDITHKSDVGGVRLNLRNSRQVASAFDDMLADAREKQPAARIDGVNVQPMFSFRHARETFVGLSRDPVFGPVIAFGAGGIAVEAMHDIALALPPLNHMLADELLRAARIHRVLDAYRNVPAVDHDALRAVLLNVSMMACMLPWIREMDLNPVLAHPDGAAALDARIVVDHEAAATDPRYRHMAIFPYPVELERKIALRDGTDVRLRPIRPDDAARERALVAAMSDVSRYFRFMHPVAELSADTIARFTQLDYAREMAIVAIPETLTDETPTTDEQFAGVARYYPNPDHVTVEFAIAVADAWQSRGLGYALMRLLIEAARSAGYAAMEGSMLPQNHGMLKLASTLGFAIEPAGDEVGTVKVRLPLRDAAG
jgi:acetyltransferase